MSHTPKRRRTILATILIALLAVATATTAAAHPQHRKWWQYDKAAWTETWRDDARLFRAHSQWHRQHESSRETMHHREHEELAEEHARMHFHRAISSRSGEASWYDGNGQTGACGKVLRGLYAASRTLPCGALVSVRSGGKYVLVHILDRGPFNDSNRILDLSPKAFSWLAPLGAGVISITAVHLRP